MRRTIPGHRSTSLEVARPDAADARSGTNLALDERVRAIEGTMDGILQRLVGDVASPIVLFSGGIDSGFIASRLVQMGYSDTQLVNFSFGPDDSESWLAEAVAKELGLPFTRLEAKEAPTRCLEDPGQVYPQPFGDHSTVPTSALARALVDSLDTPSVVLDGTGADGGFGLAGKVDLLLRLYSVPRPIRKLLSAPYDRTGWMKTSSAERITRAIRRTSQMPPTSSIVAQNPLGGLLYDGERLSSLYAALDSWLAIWAGRDQRRRMIAADLALTGANVFAQKALPIIEDAGHRHEFPFLDTTMVALALEGTEVTADKEPKAALKRSLEKWLPREMIYRPKRGFVDPMGRVFHDSVFLEHFDATGSGVLEGLVERRRIQQLLDHLHSGSQLPTQTLNLVWAIVFVDRWYKTALLS